jgi:hypothetical protein
MDFSGMDFDVDMLDDALLKAVPPALVKREPLEEMPGDCADVLRQYFMERGPSELEAGTHARTHTVLFLHTLWGSVGIC